MVTKYLSKGYSNLIPKNNLTNSKSLQNRINVVKTESYVSILQLSHFLLGLVDHFKAAHQNMNYHLQQPLDQNIS